MNTKDVILKLRTENGLSQDELAEKVFVTRQAVSRWENGDTVPNTETLKRSENPVSSSANAAECRWRIPSSAGTKTKH